MKNGKKSRNSWQMEILLGIGIARKTVDYDFIHSLSVSVCLAEQKKMSSTLCYEVSHLSKVVRGELHSCMRNPEQLSPAGRVEGGNG